MEFQVVIPVLISFAISVVLGPIIIPFLRKLKIRGRTVPFEESRNTDNGWCDLSDRNCSDGVILCR